MTCNDYIRRVIGVTRTFHWSITTGGAATSLAGRDLRLVIVSAKGGEQVMEFTTDANVVTFTWQGTDQHRIDKYSVVLWENYGKPNQRRVDIHNFVELIPWSSEQSGQYPDLTEDTIELNTSDFTDSCHGIPEGGTTGQVLKKKSDKDYDAEWGNESGGGDVQSNWNETDPDSPAFIQHKPTLAVVATSGSYNDLKDKPTIPTVPTNVSSFTNDAGYLTSHQDISGKQDRMGVVSVASSTALIQLADNTYYKLGFDVGTISLFLPEITDTTHIHSIVLSFTTGSTPNVTIASMASASIKYHDGYDIGASTEYEVNCLWNGTEWVVASMKIGGAS